MDHQQTAMSEAALVLQREGKAALAGVLSALICGLGQVYTGRRGRGVMLFLIFCALLALTTAVWVFGIFDAVRSGRSTGRA